MGNKMCKYCIYTTILFGLILNGKGKLFSAHFSNTSYKWNDASTQYTLVGNGLSGSLDDIQINLTSKVNEHGYGWIDARAAYQPWVEYLGCCAVNPSKIARVVDIGSGKQVYDCVAACSEFFYYGLQQSKCVCLTNMTLTSPDVTGTCSVEYCTGDVYSFCAEDDLEDNEYAVYSKSTRSIRTGEGGCMAMTINRASSPAVYYEPAPCGTLLRPYCFKNGIPFYVGTQLNWNSASTLCRSNSAVLTSPYQISGSSIITPDGTYWLAQIRKVAFYLTKDFIFGVENYCLAARVNTDNTLDLLIRSCDSHLPALEYHYIPTTSQPLPRVTTLKTTPARKRPPPPISDELLAIAVFIPGLIVVGIVAVVVWLVWRRYEFGYKGKPDIVIDTSDITYYESTDGFQVIKFSDNSDDYKIADYFDFGKPHASKETMTENEYNHINHSRHSENTDNSRNGYDVMVSNEQGMTVNGYHVFDSSNFKAEENTERDTLDYDSMSAIRDEQTPDKCGNMEQEYDTVHYETVSADIHEEPGVDSTYYEINDTQ